MKIHVSRVPPEGLKDHASYDPSTLDMERIDIRLHDPLEIDAVIVKAERELVVKANIRAPLRLVCARCLEEFARTLATEAVFSYRVQPTDIVDITDDVRQEIILAYPMVLICRPDCKGLCPTCGHNLNAAPCSHQAEAGRSPTTSTS